MVKLKITRDFWMLDYGIKDRETLIKITLKKLIFFLWFLTFSTLIVLMMVSPSLYYFTRAIENIFINKEFSAHNDIEITFESIQTANDFWQYTEGLLVDALYWEYWYALDNPTEDDDRKVLYENQLLGVPRLKQYRVKNDSCFISEHFKDMFSACYGPYSEVNKQTENLTLAENSTNSLNLTAFTYDTNASYMSFKGEMATYGTGGYFIDLEETSAEAKSQIDELKLNLWIKRNTRAVILDFTLYNANLNIFCICKLVFEFPPLGGIVTSHHFYSLRLIRYFYISDHFVLAFEIIFVLFVIYYTMEMIMLIKYFKWAYFKILWNWVDVFLIFTAYVCIGLNIIRTFIVQEYLQKYKDNPKAHIEFQWPASWQKAFNESMAIFLFMLWVKLFKYINLSKTLGQLGYTLARSAKEIMGFCFMFIVVFIAFAQVGYLLFGTQVEGFSTFGRSILTLLMTILGEFDYEELEKSCKIFAPLYFAAYIFFVFFVLLNMFLAIITDTYSEVKSEIDMKKSELEIIDLIKRCATGCCRKREIFSINKKFPGNEIIFNLRKILKLCKYEDEQIDQLLQTYDINENKPLAEIDIRIFLAQLKSTQYEKGANQRTKITVEQYVSLKNKLDITQRNVNILLAKLNKLMDKKKE